MNTTRTDQQKAIVKYNSEAAEAHLRAVMGDDMYEVFKPRKNINDFISTTANDNRGAA